MAQCFCPLGHQYITENTKGVSSPVIFTASPCFPPTEAMVGHQRRAWTWEVEGIKPGSSIPSLWDALSCCFVRLFCLLYPCSASSIHSIYRWHPTLSCETTCLGINWLANWTVRICYLPAWAKLVTINRIFSTAEKYVNAENLYSWFVFEHLRCCMIQITKNHLCRVRAL